MYWLIPLALLGLIGLLLYWELVIAEGTHLGPRVVTWLYDRAAPRYDRMKKFDVEVEADLIGLPLTEALAEIEKPLVLDVAAGTGRTARALLRQVAFDGSVVGLDLSARMIFVGTRACALWPGRVHWVRGPAHTLPFPNGAFDAVTCLEALEFLPDARAALGECVRVLRPGGWLLVTNRLGLDVLLMPGKTFSRKAFQRLLAEYPLREVRVQPWQVDYDLAWGRKQSPVASRQ